MVKSCLFLLLTCVQAAILGNYKLYDSSGYLLYDYSGNGMHLDAGWRDFVNRPLQTDRGLYFYSASHINFPSNYYKDYPGGSTLLFALWTLIRQGGTFLTIRIPSYTGGGYNMITLYWDINGSYVRLRYKKNALTTFTINETTIPAGNLYTAQWNLVAFHFSQVSANTELRVYNGATNIIQSSITFTNINFAMSTMMWKWKEIATNDLEGFIYEIWWRDDIVTDIQTTLSAIQSTPNVFTTPAELDPYKTYAGVTCNTTCINASRSCAGTSSNCIVQFNTANGCGCYDNANLKCLNCAGRYCSSYDYSTNTCSACVSNLILNNNTCGCDVGKTMHLFIATYRCINTIANCQNYHFYEGCFRCNSGYYVHCPTNPCIYQGRHCLSNCPTGYYPINTDPASCKSCETNCGTCSDNITCTACINNTYLKSGDCIAECGLGFYSNNNTMTCIQCSANCGACSDISCTQCINNTLLQLGACVNACSLGFFEDTANKICIQCSAHCDICNMMSSNLVCTTCASLYTLTNGSCVSICGLGYTFNLSTSSCEKCLTNCSSCSSNTVCTSCESGYALELIGSSDVCSICPTTCIECISISVCTKCIPNTSITPPSTICTELSVYAIMNTDGSIELIFSKNLNAELNPNLLTFRNEDLIYDSSTFILIIIEPRKRYNIRLNRILLTGFNMMTLYFPTNNDILISEYNDNLATQFLDINIIDEFITTHCSSVPNCLTCSKIEEDFRCDSCVYPNCLYPSQENRCGECCDVGTYYNQGVCEPCPSACKVCYDSSLCTECVSNASLVEGVCRCDANFSYMDGICSYMKGLRATAEIDNNGMVFLSFDNILLTEISDTSIQFLIQGSLLNSSSFILSKSEIKKTYAISIQGLSLLGIPSITLLFIDSSSILSTDLIPLQDNEITIPIPIDIRCKSSYNLIGSQNICDICPDVCLECSESRCLTCNKSYSLLNSSCVSECPSGYFKDSKMNECIRCDIDNCLSCDYMNKSSSISCIQCEDKYILMFIMGKGSCMPYPESTELDDEICISCKEQCNEYKGDISCNICLNNTEVISSNCIFSSDVVYTDIIELNLLYPTFRYSSKNQLNLDFDKPLINNLNKEYITIHVNDLQYTPDKFTIEIEHINQNYRIILEGLDISIPNTITVFFTKTFSEYKTSFLSQISLYIPSQDDLDTKENENTSESQYSSKQITQGKKAREISDNVSTGSSVVITVSIASGGTYAWNFLSTIQIFSFLNLLQVEMPLILKSCIETQEDYYIAYNLLHNIVNDSTKPYKKAQDFKYPSSNFLLNIGKPLFVLSIITFIHLLSKIALKLAKGKLNLLLNKVMIMFNYGIYLRFLIQMYIEFSVPALLQLLYVFNI